MLDLTEIEFFSRLAPDALARVRAVTEDRAVATGTVICRRRDEGRAFHVVASGGWWSKRRRRRLETPGGCIWVRRNPRRDVDPLGAPVSATVIAVQPTRLFRDLPRVLSRAPAERTGAQLALSQLLIRRIRQRTGATREGRQGVVVLDGAWHSEPAQDLARALHRGVVTTHPGRALLLGPPRRPTKRWEEWREGPGAGRYLLLVSDSSSPARWDHRLERGDAISYAGCSAARGRRRKPRGTPMGLADRAVVEFEWEAARNSTTREEWFSRFHQAKLRRVRSTRPLGAAERCRRSIDWCAGWHGEKSASRSAQAPHWDSLISAFSKYSKTLGCLSIAWRGRAWAASLALAYAREERSRGH